MFSITVSPSSALPSPWSPVLRKRQQAQNACWFLEKKLIEQESSFLPLLFRSLRDCVDTTFHFEGRSKSKLDQVWVEFFLCY